MLVARRTTGARRKPEHRTPITPTTTPTRPEAVRTHLRAATRKIGRIPFIYSELPVRTRATTHVQKQTFPLSHGGGQGFESPRVHFQYSLR